MGGGSRLIIVSSFRSIDQATCSHLSGNDAGSKTWHLPCIPKTTCVNSEDCYMVNTLEMELVADKRGQADWHRSLPTSTFIGYHRRSTTTPMINILLSWRWGLNMRCCNAQIDSLDGNCVELDAGYLIIPMISIKSNAWWWWPCIGSTSAGLPHFSLAVRGKVFREYPRMSGHPKGPKTASCAFTSANIFRGCHVAISGTKQGDPSFRVYSFHNINAFQTWLVDHHG